MKKNLMFVVVFLFMFSSNTFTQDRDPIKKPKGGYLNRDIYIYNYKLGKVDNNSKSIEEKHKFDNAGNLLLDEEYDNGEIFRSVKSKFDNYGNIIEIEWYDDTNYPIKKGLNQYTYKYDGKGNILEKVEYENGQVLSIVKSKFDERGNILEKEVFDSDGSSVVLILYKYNRNGKEIENLSYEKNGGNDNGIEENKVKSEYVHFEKKYYNNGKLKESLESRRFELDEKIYYKSNYKYDENGNEVEEFSYYYGAGMFGIVGVSEYKCISQYDENNNLIKKIKYEDGESIILDQNKYDKNGNILEKISWDFDGMHKRQIQYSYDKNGKLFEEVKYDEDEKIFFSKVNYKYDSYENIMEKFVIVLDDAPLKITYKYDGFGNILEESYYNGNVLTFAYKYIYSN